MGKAYSVAAKKRNRKGGGKRAMFKRLVQVQEIMREAETVTQEDPRRVVKEARARMMGGKSTDGMLDAKLCTPAGMAIYLSKAKDAEVLWQVISDFEKAQEAYFRRIIGKHKFPNVSKTEFMPETFEARADDRPDTRTDEEKDAAARKGWDRWAGYMNQLPLFQQRAITGASWQMTQLHKGARLTVHGESFIAALRALSDVVEARA